jgi:hypothetical protein
MESRSSDLESHAFETHLHRLRKKINKFFKDKEFIVRKEFFILFIQVIINNYSSLAPIC